MTAILLDILLLGIGGLVGGGYAAFRLKAPGNTWKQIASRLAGGPGPWEPPGGP